MDLEKRRQEIKDMAVDGSRQKESSTEAAATPQEKTRLQLQRLFKDLPGHVSLVSAYAMHRAQKLQPKLETPLPEKEFEEIWHNERDLHRVSRRRQLAKKKSTRRNFMAANTGYKEEDEVYEAEEPEFQDDWRLKSIIEDCWKAEYYQQLHRKAREDIPEREHLAVRTDRMADVVAGALRSHYTEQNRPVLTHELADFENPYMMKHSAMERLLQERCVRNQLDERCLPRLLERHPDLVKLRRQAQLPPEVLEPLAAFRGDARWHFDARERLGQKLSATNSALQAVVDTGGDGAAVRGALPENEAPSPDQVPGVRHPWRNHLGFESAVPYGTAGGTKFGQPLTKLEEQIRKMRYPTLQRVAHTLPADPKWRAHVTRTIRVLERSKHWDFASKLDAVNRLKTVYDELRPSAEYTAGLDEKLPLNRVPSHLKRKYARNVQYVKTFPKKFRKRVSFTRYRASLTATAPLRKEKSK